MNYIHISLYIASFSYNPGRYGCIFGVGCKMLTNIQTRHTVVGLLEGAVDGKTGIVRPVDSQLLVIEEGGCEMMCGRER